MNQTCCGAKGGGSSAQRGGWGAPWLCWTVARGAFVLLGLCSMAHQHQQKLLASQIRPVALSQQEDRARDCLRYQDGSGHVGSSGETAAIPVVQGKDSAQILSGNLPATAEVNIRG